MFFFAAIFSLIIPALLVIGFVYLLKTLFGKPATSPITSRQAFLRQFIHELSLEAQAHPDRTVSEQINEYENELAAMGVLIQPSHQVTTPPPPPPNKQRTIINKQSTKWTNEQFTQLLLYVGAFLVVASAVTFVSFQWETFTGLTKSLLISFLTLAFLAGGYYTYRVPTTRLAGATFSAIGSILIPLTGVAWYNFYFHLLDIEAGIIWLFTSLISLVVYAYYSRYFDSSLYTFAASISLYSFIASLFNTASLSGIYYILAGLLTGVLLQLINWQLQETREFSHRHQAAVGVTANFVVVLSLLWGLLYAAAQQQFSTPETSLALMLGAAYFLITYVLKHKTEYLGMSLTLIPLSLVSLLRWGAIETATILHTLTFVSFIYAGSSIAMKQKAKYPTERNLIMWLALLLSTLIFLTGQSAGLPVDDVVRFSFALVVIGLTTTLVLGSPSFLLVSSFFWAHSSYLFIVNILNLPPTIVSMWYLVMGLALYALAILARQHKDVFMVIIGSSIWFLFLNYVYGHTDRNLLLLITLTWTVLSLITAEQFKRYTFLYAAQAALYLTIVTQLRRWYEIEDLFIQLPLFSGVIFGLLYSAKNYAPDQWRYYLRKAGLFGVLGASVFFIHYLLAPNAPHIAQVSALFATIIAFFVFLADALETKKSPIAYSTSAIGMFFYVEYLLFWQINETLLYTVPVGIYLLVLAYLQYRQKNRLYYTVLELSGLFLLLIPTFLASFGPTGAKDALILGLLGIGLLFAGHRLTLRHYLYLGVAAIVSAVLSQTYQEILSLERWIVTGGVGLLFLGAAVYLMHRKENLSTNS